MVRARSVAWLKMTMRAGVLGSDKAGAGGGGEGEDAAWRDAMTVSGPNALHKQHPSPVFLLILYILMRKYTPLPPKTLLCAGEAQDETKNTLPCSTHFYFNLRGSKRHPPQLEGEIPSNRRILVSCKAPNDCVDDEVYGGLLLLLRLLMMIMPGDKSFAGVFVLHLETTTGSPFWDQSFTWALRKLEFLSRQAMYSDQPVSQRLSGGAG